jgi:N-methylhydantoinase A
VDPGGALRVGPTSAGAEPGPVCYGRGGTRPTVTDCNLILGYLDQSSLLGGRMTIDYDAAAAAIDVHLARPLGLTVSEAAASVIRIVNNTMAEALRIVSVERGHDPREFGMVAFGGAGPLHAAALAEELEIPEIIIPPIPGGFSALGLVGADIRRDYSKTLYGRLSAISPEIFQDIWDEMQANAEEMLAEARIDRKDWQFRRSAGLRYARQAYELNVPVPQGKVTAAMLSQLVSDFHAKHEQTYGHFNENERVNVVTLRLTAIGKLPSLNLAQPSAEAATSLKGTRKTWFAATGEVAAEIHERSHLAHGAQVAGPAVIESLDSTIVVPPRWIAGITDKGFVRMERQS